MKINHFSYLLFNNFTNCICSDNIKSYYLFAIYVRKRG